MEKCQGCIWYGNEVILRVFLVQFQSLSLATLINLVLVSLSFSSFNIVDTKAPLKEIFQMSCVARKEVLQQKYHKVVQ